MFTKKFKKVHFCFLPSRTKFHSNCLIARIFDFVFILRRPSLTCALQDADPAPKSGSRVWASQSGLNLHFWSVSGDLPFLYATLPEALVAVSSQSKRSATSRRISRFRQSPVWFEFQGVKSIRSIDTFSPTPTQKNHTKKLENVFDTFLRWSIQ